MAEWFRRKDTKISTTSKKDIKEGMWVKCFNCDDILSRKILKEKFNCCQSCGYHFRISADQYISLLIDENYIELWKEIKSQDPLNFKASKSYKEQIEQANEKTNAFDAVKVISGKIKSKDVILCVMDFSFIGGSMGSVVGEKISRAIKKSQDESIPLIIICSSGGARMQEGAISLMQLAKICSKLAEFSSKKNLLITILTDPTMGGTTASYAMLGDIILAEPNALIGFAGQRVIKQTIGEDLPDGFQRAEFLKEHGFIDQIISREKMKETLADLVSFFAKKDMDGVINNET
tara:strand:+ start:1509 stop:2381 length:873 start_codon:yes stop_codon:yes gene_type:complete